MNIRKFWLINGKNQTIQFADSISKIFINNPTGLGISNTLTTNQYTDRLDLKNKEQSFHQVGGEYLFYDVSNKDKYQQYNDFITFLTYKPLMFYYQIPTEPAETYSCEVEVLSIEKTEVKTDGALRCNFSLQSLTRWQGDEIVYTTSELPISMEIENPSHMPVGFEITITGNNMKNVIFQLTQDNNLYGVARFNDQINYYFDKVYVNSNDGLQDVVLENDGAVIANPLAYQDFSYSRDAIYVTFLKLARGTSTLSVFVDDGTINSVDVKFIPIYRSV